MFLLFYLFFDCFKCKWTSFFIQILANLIDIPCQRVRILSSCVDIKFWQRIVRRRLNFIDRLDISLSRCFIRRRQRTFLLCNTCSFRFFKKKTTTTKEKCWQKTCKWLEPRLGACAVVDEDDDDDDENSEIKLLISTGSCLIGASIVVCWFSSLIFLLVLVTRCVFVSIWTRKPRVCRWFVVVSFDWESSAGIGLGIGLFAWITGVFKWHNKLFCFLVRVCCVDRTCVRFGFEWVEKAFSKTRIQIEIFIRNVFLTERVRQSMTFVRTLTLNLLDRNQIRTRF